MADRRRWAALAVLMLVLAGCDEGGSSPGDETDSGRQIGEDAGPEPDDDGGRDDTGPPPGDSGTDAGATDGAPPVPDDEPEDVGDLSLNSIIPNRGDIAGGTEIRLVGTGFVEGVEFRFGPALSPCAQVRILSQNHARCVTPPGAVGPADVLAYHRVVGPGGAADVRQSLRAGAFTYFEPVSLTAIRPDRSPLRGGIPIRIDGTGLVDGTRVVIGGTRVDTVTVQQDGSLEVLAPPGQPGPADVMVSNFNGSASLPGGLFYYEELTVRGIDPPVGPLGGGITSTLRGSGLTADARVTFGERAAEVQRAAADRSTVEVLVPRGQVTGPVDVVVANDNGEALLRRGFVYYDDVAVEFGVAGIAPGSGPVEGGNTVFVAGAGFTRQTRVTVGGRVVPCEFLDAHRLRCTMPPGEIGPADVEVADGARSVSLPEGYVYFQTLELIAVTPRRGSVAGGTVVTLTGSGFRDDMVVELGGQALAEVQVLNDGTAVGKTPPNTPGPVDVTVRTDYTRADIVAGYTYFDPVTQFGGVWGEPIRGAINVTVLNGGSGAPEPEAAVLVVADGGNIVLEGLTNAQGQLTLSTPPLRGPAEVTAAKEGFEVTTIEDVEVENVTIYLIPNDGEGSPPPGVPAAILGGVVTGLDVLPKPVNERYVNVIVIETSHSSPYNRTQLPPPGPGGLVLEDGPFEIIARPGELALIATAGEIDRDALKAYQDGEIGYWDMRFQLNPLAMGLRRFISAAPGQQIHGLNIEVNHRMDLVIPVDLDNPPAGANPGPQFYAVLPRLDLGAEGYWELDTQAVGLEPGLRLTKMPRLDGWDADIRYYLIGLAFSPTADNTPMSVSIEETRNVDAGVLISPFVGSPFFIEPQPGGQLGLERRVTWGVHDGFDGPIRAPSANLVTIEEPALGPPKPLWRYVTPSLVTEFEVPVLPAEAGGAGLGAGIMFLNIYPFIIDGQFDFNDFTYDDLAQFRWKSWGVGATTFRQ